jgi:general secretion pathway protein N
MARFLSALAAVALLLAASILFVPAVLLDGRLDAATQGHLRLADAAGTIWNGRGRITNAQRTWSLPVRWRVDPLSFLRGNPTLTLEPADGGDLPRGRVGWGDAGLALDGVAFTLPAAVLNGTVADANTLALGGFVAVDAPHFRWSRNGGDGAATAQWTGARIAAAGGALALGTVTANFAPRNGRLMGMVENRGGEVHIDGEIALDDADADVRATLTPSPSAPSDVAHKLSMLGAPDAAGAVHLQWRAALR